MSYVLNTFNFSQITNPEPLGKPRTVLRVGRKRAPNQDDRLRLFALCRSNAAIFPASSNTGIFNSEMIELFECVCRKVVSIFTARSKMSFVNISEFKIVGSELLSHIKITKV